MARASKRRTTRGFRYILDLGPGDEEVGEEFERFCAGRDIPLNGDDGTDPEDVKIQKLEDLSEKPMRIKRDSPMFRVWGRWLELKEKAYPGTGQRYSISSEEMKHISNLLRQYGEDQVYKIIEVAIKDWPAMCRRYKDQVPDVPTLREVYRYREMLKDAAVRSGITSSAHRVSQYKGDSPYAKDPWKEK
jgi:hypothetical protein